MNKNDSIDDMVTKFTKITNGLSSLGDEIDNDQKVRKVIWSLPTSWEVKETTLKELNDKEEMELIGLIGNLKTHKMEWKAREEKGPQKTKVLAFKSTPTISDKEEEDQKDDEDLSLLVKNVRRMYNNVKFGSRRRWQEKEERKLVCNNYQKSGHVIAECPENKSKPSTSKKPYKNKTLKAT